jgi:hypothetical protein
MARIKIEDIPEDRKLGKDVMKKIRGGLLINDETTLPEDEIIDDYEVDSGTSIAKRPGRVKY